MQLLCARGQLCLATVPRNYASQLCLATALTTVPHNRFCFRHRFFIRFLRCVRFLPANNLLQVAHSSIAACVGCIKCTAIHPNSCARSHIIALLLRDDVLATHFFITLANLLTNLTNLLTNLTNFLTNRPDHCSKANNSTRFTPRSSLTKRSHRPKRSRQVLREQRA